MRVVIVENDVDFWGNFFNMVVIRIEVVGIWFVMLYEGDVNFNG